MIRKRTRTDIQEILIEIAGDLEHLIAGEKLWTVRHQLLIEHLRYALQVAGEALPKNDRHLVHRLVNLSREVVEA